MLLPESEILRVDKLLSGICRKRSIEGEVTLTYQIRGNRVTLIESRPFFVDPSTWFDVKVAQFEFNSTTHIWTLYWYNLKNKRFPYPTGRNKDSLEKLTIEVEKDPTGIFWG
jgi:hypothetical protein